MDELGTSSMLRVEVRGLKLHRTMPVRSESASIGDRVKHVNDYGSKQ